MAVLGDNTPIDIVPGADLYFPIYRYLGVQRVTVLGSPTGGTVTLTYRGAGPAVTVAYNASTATVQAALESLSTIGPGNVVVTGSPGAWDIAGQRMLDTLTFLKYPLTVTASLSGGTSPHVLLERPLDNCTGRHYELQARSVAGSPTPKILVNDAGAGTDGEVDMTNAATGVLVVHIDDAKTATLDFSDGGTQNQATWVFMEITASGAKKEALVDSGTFRLKGKYYV